MPPARMTGLILQALSLVAAAIGVLGTIHTGLAFLAVRRFTRRQIPDASPLPAVTVLKPLHGAEPDLAANLASFARQDYPAPVQLLCGVQDRDDPALRAVEALAADGLAMECVVDPRLHGPNRKVGNLANMLPSARHELLVIADSDMRVPPDYLRHVAAPFADPGVGLVTCLYRGVAAGGPWSALAAAGINYHFLPSVLVGLLLGIAQGCFGSTMALRRRTLERLGGFPAFADRLADDYALGAAVRGLGLQVVVAPLLIDHVSYEPTFRALWAHELRWARTIRLLSPWGHAGTLVTHALPGAAISVVLAPRSPAAWTLLTVVVLARLAFAVVVDARLAIRPRGWPLVLARDLLSFAVLVASFFGRGVVWRGRRYQVSRHGVMVERGAAWR